MDNPLGLQDVSPTIDAGVIQYTTNDGESVPPTPITNYAGTAPDLGWKEFAVIAIVPGVDAPVVRVLRISEQKCATASFYLIKGKG